MKQSQLEEMDLEDTWSLAVGRVEQVLELKPGENDSCLGMRNAEDKQVGQQRDSR